MTLSFAGMGVSMLLMAAGLALPALGGAWFPPSCGSPAAGSTVQSAWGLRPADAYAP